MYFPQKCKCLSQECMYLSQECMYQLQECTITMKQNLKEGSVQIMDTEGLIHVQIVQKLSMQSDASTDSGPSKTSE